MEEVSVLLLQLLYRYTSVCHDATLAFFVHQAYAPLETLLKALAHPVLICIFLHLLCYWDVNLCLGGC